MLNLQRCITCSTTACWKLGNRHIKKETKTGSWRRMKEKEVRVTAAPMCTVHVVFRFQSTMCGLATDRLTGTRRYVACVTRPQPRPKLVLLTFWSKFCSFSFFKNLESSVCYTHYRQAHNAHVRMLHAAVMV